MINFTLSCIQTSTTTMKKICTSLAVLLAAGASAQTIDNAGMETWRAGTSGTAPVVTIAAPTQWHGFDSLVVAAGQLFGSIIGAGSDWKQQIYQENTFVHGGSAAAKLITVEQDVLGFIPGTLANAEPVLDAGVLAGGGDPQDAISFSGGTATTLRPTTVSAWVAFYAGKDATSGAFGGDDAGVLNVQAIATVAGADSVVGVGSATIAPSAAYTEITANVDYTTTDYNVHTVRIIFASGGGSGGGALDSSILFVDDVSMTGVPQAVTNVYGGVQVVKVAPNPATGMLYLNGLANAGYTCTLMSVTGRIMATQQLKGADKINISAIPSGLYIYRITDVTGVTVQTGKVDIRN
jgi:hypothetical protein